jgi:hypothetical protein
LAENPGTPFLRHQMLSEICLGVQVNCVDHCHMWFFIVILVLLVTKFTSAHHFVILFVASGIPIFRAVDSRFVACLNELSHSSPSFTDWGSYVSYVALPVLFLLFGIVGVVLLEPDQSLVLECASGVVWNIIFYLATTEVKLMWIIWGFVDARQCRRGFFAAVQRGFVLARSIIAVLQWVHYFRLRSSIWLMYIYLVIRLVYIARLTLDLTATWWNYSANGVESARRIPHDQVTDICAVCRSAPDEPRQLECGHIFCQGCLERWLMGNPSCPICRRKTKEHVTIELADGRTELPFILFPF